ncbi:MAG TPA: hypothetical protein PKI60_00485 [Oscillospiraceae bacterium]|nr:hypothetical protein [Oscillospiraceae bacterium]
MNMRIEPHYKNHMREWFKGLFVLSIVLVAIFIMTLIVEIIIPGGGDGSTSAIESIGIIFIFVSGIAKFKQSLKHSFANGISRKTEFVTSLLSGATASVIMVFGFIALGFLFSLITPYKGLFDEAFNAYNFSSVAEYAFNRFFYDFFGYFGSYIAGACIGALYYRMNRVLRIAVSVGVPCLFIFGSGGLAYAAFRNDTLRNFFETILNFITRVMSQPLTNNILTIVNTVICAVIYFLLIRKAPIKENA